MVIYNIVIPPNEYLVVSRYQVIVAEQIWRTFQVHKGKDGTFIQTTALSFLKTNLYSCTFSK